MTAPEMLRRRARVGHRGEVVISSSSNSGGRTTVRLGVILDVSAGGVVTADLAAERGRTVVVSGDGSGNLRTVQEAADAVPGGNRGRFVIRIRPVTWKERIDLLADLRARGRSDH
jgi:hypothetical protein